MTEKESESGGGVRSVQLTLDVLEMLARVERKLGITEMATELGLPKGTVFRHVQTLAERGYLTRTDDARYGLGTAAFLLGQAARAGIDLLSVATPVAERLVDVVGQTVVLSTPGRDCVRVLHTTLGRSSIEIGFRPGSVLAFHASAQGKVALAFCRDLRLSSRKPLPAFTPHTITDHDRLADEVATIWSRGWATAPEQVMLGINALAAPVFDASGRCTAQLAIVGSIQFVPVEPVPSQVDAVIEAARAISSALGWRDTPPAGTPSA